MFVEIVCLWVLIFVHFLVDLETHKRTEFQPKVYFALTDLQDLDVLKQIKEYEGTNYGNLYPYALTLEEDIFEFRMHVV